MRLGIDRNVSCTVHRRRNQGGTRGMCPPLSFQSVPYISCTTNEILHTVPPPIKKSFLRLCSGWLCISSRSIFKWNVVWWLFMYKLQWYSPTWQNPLLIWKALILCSSFFQLLYLVGVLLPDLWPSNLCSLTRYVSPIALRRYLIFWGATANVLVVTRES